jgi:RNA polymerase sigma-70 factor (ECF subfamily)
MNHRQPSNDIPENTPSGVTSIDISSDARLPKEDDSVNKIEISLIRAIMRGDCDAMTQLYDIYYPRLHRFLTGMIQDRELIMELINDVMLIVWQTAVKFRGKSLVSTWIFGISYHRALDRIRKDKRYREVLDEVPRQTQADNSLNESITTRDLNIIMQVLSPEQQAVAKLAFEFGYSYPEIAEILKIPANTVKTRMFHARKLMQQAVNQGVTNK